MMSFFELLAVLDFSEGLLIIELFFLRDLALPVEMVLDFLFIGSSVLEVVVVLVIS